MKYIKRTFILISLITIALNGFSSGYNKYYPDTVHLQMPNNTTIEYMSLFKNEKCSMEDVKLNQLLNDFFKMWNILKKNDLNPNQSIHITCDTRIDEPDNYNKSISINEFFQQTKLTFPSNLNQVLYIIGKHKLEFRQPKYSLFIYFNTISQLEELKDYDFNKIFKDTDTALLLTKKFASKRESLVAWVAVDKHFSPKLITQTLSGVNNFFYITLGTGLNNVKGHWNGSFFGSLTYIHRNSLKPLMATSYIYEYMYDFSESNQTNINIWGGLKYSINVSSSNEKANWLGLSLEYLVKPKGNLFKDHSLRLGFEKSIHDNVSIVPQIYFNDFFKNVYPGINIKVII